MKQSSSLLTSITSDAVLDAAYHWLCTARQDSHHNNDVWHLRFYWQDYKQQIQDQLRQGCYRFEPCKTLYVNGESMGHWCAKDALVIKAITLVLTEKLAPKLSQHCYHLVGRGGAKGCVSKIKKHVKHYRFVCRSDVDSYYATIDHKVLLKQLAKFIKAPDLMALLTQVITRLDSVNGELMQVIKGISKGNPLSPLLGAIYLYGMDKALGDYCEKHGLKYYRYMDDWLVLCKSRHQLRHVVKLMNQCLDEVKQTKHPYKTYIGRIKETGFDFLGYRITPDNEAKVSLAWKTIANHIHKLKQLYEQGASNTRIAEYVKRWLQWARSGVEIDLQQVLQVIKASALGSGLVEKGVWG